MLYFSVILFNLHIALRFRLTEKSLQILLLRFCAITNNTNTLLSN